MKSGQDQSRIKKLDSIRGLAATMVLVEHVLATAQLPWWLHVLWSGTDAVTMFFLLSGYVLALRLASPLRPSYSEFVIRRIFRIWPAFAVAMVISFLALSLLHAKGLSEFLPIQLRDPSTLTWQTLAMNLLMFTDEKLINPPVWSLFVEMRVSLVFPLLMLFVMSRNFWSAVLISILFSVLASRLVNAGLGAIAFDIGSTSRFLCLFAVGAALTRIGNPCGKFYAGLPSYGGGVILVFAIICLEYRFFPMPLPLQNYVPWIGVTAIFVLCLYSQVAERFLNHATLVTLGRLSFGIYLIHFPIIAVLRSLFPEISLWALTPLVFFFSVSLAYPLYVWIEKPMIRLGKRLTSRERHVLT